MLTDVSFVLDGGARVALLGENGSGKTTLLRCITGELPCGDSIRIGRSIRIGMVSQEQSELRADRSVLEAFRFRTEMSESDARTYLHRFLFSGDEVLKQLVDRIAQAIPDQITVLYQPELLPTPPDFAEWAQKKVRIAPVTL